MKKFAPVLVIVGIIILGFLYFMNVKNKALLFSQATEKEWGNVNTAYQRRLDLIDNLVNAWMSCTSCNCSLCLTI